MYLLVYSLCPVLGWVAFNQLKLAGYNAVIAGAGALLFSYVPAYLNVSYKKDGMVWEGFRRWNFWKRFAEHFYAKIGVESPLDPNQQYIFCNFPHGAMSVNHMFTMTDGCGMLSSIYPGPRRDLAASALFAIPIVRELVMWMGCVDASSSTAHYNMKKGRSILIFIGGEKEQLMTQPNEHKIYLRNRKGFIKLALEYGAHLIPMYAYGENECYDILPYFMGFRTFLQHNFKIGLPLIMGRYGWTLLPHRIPIQIEMGSPLVVEKIEDRNQITDKQIDELHSKFCEEMVRLFDRTKESHGVGKDVQLAIL